MNRVARALAVRPGEAGGIGLVAALFAVVEGARGLGEVGADTLVLSRVGASSLPSLFVALGAVSLIVALGFGAAVGRLRLGPFLSATLLGFAIVLIALRIVVASGVATLLPVAWLVVYMIGGLLATLTWTIAGAAFDARQAKRLFPLCTSAAILGGFAGTLASGPIARLAGAETLLAVEGALLAVAAGLGAAVTRRFGRTLTARRRAAPLVDQLRSGFEYVASSPLMRLVAGAYVAFGVLAFAVSFPFLRAMSSTFPAEADLATALGLLSAAVTAASFVTSIAVANRVYARLGIATAALVLPVVYVVGFATWLVAFGVATAIAVRFAQQVVQRGLSNAAWSAFFNVVPGERRPQVLAFMDGVPGQLGIALSGILLIAANTLLAPAQVPWLGLAAALLLLWLVIRVRRRYAQSLVATLRTGLAEQMLEGGPGLTSLSRDPQVLEQLRAGLADPSAHVRSLSAELLGRIGRSEALADIVTLLADESPAARAAAAAALRDLEPTAAASAGLRRLLEDLEPIVRTAAVRALAHQDMGSLTERCDALAADADPRVRAELAVALIEHDEEDRAHAILAALLESPAAADRVAGLEAVARLGGHSPSARLAASLSDPVAAVRAMTIRALAALDTEPDRIPLLARALDDDADVVRLAAARGLNEHFEEARPAILGALAGASERAQAASLLALDGHGAEVREVLLDWSTAQVARATALREHERSLATDDGTRPDGDSDGDGSGSAFLRDILRRREWQIEERLLSAVAIAGAPEASGLLRRCLRSNDAEIRAQAMEALDTLGDRALSGQLVRLLEDDDIGRPRDPLDVLRDLTRDPDPWVRALAVHGLSARLRREWQTTVARARQDTDAIVRAAAGQEGVQGGDPVPQTRDTLGEIERMLFLRRVPLFKELAPEDLQRIAATAIERLYPAGEPLVSEGDLGDELVVIVEGAVRVVRGQGDNERTLRTYEAGDHIGELAVLRERPRAATVIALEGGVRGLVIGGEGLRAVLRERPEAAMAMLATLAERISAQQ